MQKFDRFIPSVIYETRFNTVDSLIAVLHEETSTWMDKFKQTAKEFNLNMAAFKLTINSNENLPAITNINDLLQKLSACTNVIDEANELHRLINKRWSFSTYLNG